MPRCFQPAARIAWAIVIGVTASFVWAEEGPSLLGPDAQPPRMTPTIKERQVENNPSNASIESRRQGHRSTPADRPSDISRHPYSSQAAPQARAAQGNVRPQTAPPPRREQAFGSAEPSAPSWSQASRGAPPPPQHRQASRPSDARMTPEQLNRYRAQMQQRGTQAPLDPRRQQALSQRQRESLATSPPKRNDRSLFEPPAARQNQSPGQPRPIVIGGAPGMSRSAQPTASRGPYSNSYNANRPNVQYGNAVSRGPMQSRAR